MSDVSNKADFHQALKISNLIRLHKIPYRRSYFPADKIILAFENLIKQRSNSISIFTLYNLSRRDFLKNSPVEHFQIKSLGP